LPRGLEQCHPAGRRPSLSESEVLTILCLYHLSGFKCFAYYYERLVLGELRSYFSRAVSYTHFLELARQALLHAFLLLGFKGKCYGDKGYLSSLLEELLEQGLHLVAKGRRNMKNMLLSLPDKLNLLKRGNIEAVNDMLMTVCDIDHTRHRNPLNALVQIFSGLTAYTFLDQKSRCKPAKINA
jgi:hypothetical protein